MPPRRLVGMFLAVAAAVSAISAAEIPVSGLVLASDGRPVPDAQVLLLPLTEPVAAARLDREGRLPEPAAKAVTTQQGEFLLIAPRAGVYRVRVEAPGFVPRERLLVPLLEPADLPEATLERDSGLTLRVADRAGAPIAGAVARVAETGQRGPIDDRWSAPPVTVATGKDGTVRLPGPFGIRSVLTVSAPGYLVAERRGVRGDSVTVKLEPGLPVRIDVRSADGTPAKGVLAVAGDRRHPLGTTDESGALALALPVKGALPVTLHAADGRRLEERVSPPPKDRPGPVRLVLPERLAIAGRVIDLETRAPIASALVWNDARPWEAVATDDGGRYTLGVPAADGGVLVGGASGFLRSEPQPLASLAAGRPGPTLALEPAAAVEGIVVDADGRPIAGAEVDLDRRMEGGIHRIFIGGRSTAPQGVTSSRGRFRLSPVDATPRYDLKVNAAGYSTATLEVPALQRRRTLQDVRISLSRGRKAVGRVVDGDGRAIAGASAELRPAPRRESARTVSMAAGASASEERSAVSDANGRFEIGALAAGTYDLEVRRKGFARKTLSGVDVANTAEPSDLGDVVLAPGERIQGRVVDPTGKPVDGVEVSIARDGGGGMMRFAPLSSSSRPASPDAVTSPDGWFSLDDLTRGEPLELSFTRTAYVPKREAGVAVPRRDPLEVVMHPASKVSGTVVDPDRKPVPFAQVTLTAQRGGGVGGQRIMMVMRRPGAADSLGRFLFEDVEPGKISLGASAAGWQEATLDDLEVIQGEDLTGIDLPLKPGAIVEGHVLAPDGRPAIGAEVSKVDERPQMVRFRGTATDGDGYYRIEGLAPGKVSIEANHEGWTRVVKDLDARPGANALDLQFQGGQDVSGRVVDATGATVGGAWVRLGGGSRFFGGPDVTTEIDGTFRFEGVGDGDYELTAGKRGYAPLMDGTSVRVAGAPVSDLTVTLQPGVVVTGTVSGLEPEKLAKVEVQAAGAGSPWPLSSSPVDRQGRYRIEDLAPGDWRLTALHVQSGQQARGDLTIPAGATEATLDLRFGGGITLSGLVVQGDNPVRGADVAATGTDVEASGRGRTDSDGRFSIGGLDPGNYRLDLNQWDTGLFHEEAVEVRGTKEITVRIPTAKISGRVIDAADRQPVSGARVVVTAPDAGVSGSPLFRLDRATSTDLDGRFSISNVGDGAFKVSATAKGYAAKTADVTVRSGRDIENVALALDPTEGLSLEVRLESGRPPDEVSVAVLDPGGRSVVGGSYATGENGHVRISTVPPGSWELLVSAGASATVSFRASAPGGAPVPVRLPPASSLDVRIPSLEKSAAAATATVTGADGRPYRELSWYGDPRTKWRLAAGRARIEGLPPGSWNVTVTSSEGVTWSGTAQTAPGAPAVLNLE